MSARVVVALSGHGFGHAAQAAPVVNELRSSIPDMDLVLWSTLPPELLASRYAGPFELVRRASDVGLAMSSSLDVRRAESAATYEDFHATFDAGVEEDRELLRRRAPDLVLCDVPYRPLVAAAAEGIPAVALCSLNWADVYQSYCGDADGASEIRGTIEAAYRQAVAFVRPEPAMPMSWLPDSLSIGPVCARVKPRRDALRQALGITSSRRVLLLAMGGVPEDVPIERWPLPEGWAALAPARLARRASWVHDVDALGSKGFLFTEVLASSDLVVTKPGYNTFVEAAVFGVPVVYVLRGDWPEEPFLAAWLRQHARCREISRAELRSGRFLAQAEALCSASPPPPPEPTGAAEAARLIRDLL